MNIGNFLGLKTDRAKRKAEIGPVLAKGNELRQRQSALFQTRTDQAELVKRMKTDHRFLAQNGGAAGLRAAEDRLSDLSIPLAAAEDELRAFEAKHKPDELAEELRQIQEAEQAEEFEQDNKRLVAAVIEVDKSLNKTAEADRKAVALFGELQRKYPGVDLLRRNRTDHGRLPVEFWVGTFNPATPAEAAYTTLARYREELAQHDVNLVPENSLARKKAMLAKQMGIPVSQAPAIRE